MTHNQIDYWNLEETRRHNRTTETETGRHNLATEQEETRHNKTTENIAISNLQETQRHNIATESETQRHNMVGESQVSQQMAETKRHNQVTEQQAANQLAEANRHNAVSEYQNAVNLSIDANKAAETVRHNIATETETSRHNVVSERIELARNAFEKQYKDTMASVSRLQSVNNVSLTSAQTREIDARIKKMQEDIKIAQQSNTISGWNTASSAASNLGKIVTDVLRLVTRK